MLPARHTRGLCSPYAFCVRTAIMTNRVNIVRPQHIAIIMDGNGRWAQQHGKPRLAGHEAGAETVRRVLRLCRDAGIRYLTLYAFSTENWKRPTAEVSGLMHLLQLFLKKEKQALIEQQVRLHVIGQRDDLPAAVQSAIADVEEATKLFDNHLILALSYSGRSELVRTMRKIAQAVQRGAITPDSISEETLASALDTAGIPDPDLIIRTSGEFRVSNFLLWQCAYSEFYITQTCWPDFREQEFNDALTAFAARERRYGGITSTK